MLDLDFAFFNLINTDRRGIAFKKIFLDRLAPIFFFPRVEKLIDLRELNSRGCNIILPLGQGNLRILEPENQRAILNKSTTILNEYKLQTMAVDRRLKPQFLELSNGFSPVFGDNFIKALAFVLIRESLVKKKIGKMIIVGDTEKFPNFIEELTIYDVPISIQNYNPSRYELLAHHLLYEKGYAVSTSYLNPENWGDRDLVVMLDLDGQQLAIRYPEAFYIRLSNNSCNIAPQLEKCLLNSGIDCKLHNLAPIMESCLLSKAGFLSSSEEQDKANKKDGKYFILLQELGDELGLWDLFLDKII